MLLRPLLRFEGSQNRQDHAGEPAWRVAKMVGQRALDLVIELADTVKQLSHNLDIAMSRQYHLEKRLRKLEVFCRRFRRRLVGAAQSPMRRQLRRRRPARSRSSRAHAATGAASGAAQSSPPPTPISLPSDRESPNA